MTLGPDELHGSIDSEFLFGLVVIRWSATAAAGLATVVLCAAGGVAGLTFTSNLDDLLAVPLRYGFPADFQIADADRPLAETFANDDRFDSVVYVLSADSIVDGRSTVGTSLEALAGPLDWELQSGRPPTMVTDVVLSVRLAQELEKGVGDLVALRDISGRLHEFGVVGVGVVSNYDLDIEVGRVVGMTADGVRLAAAAEPYGAVALTVRPGLDPDAIADDLNPPYEIIRAGYPVEVSNLAQIRSLVVISTTMLLIVACVAMGYATLTNGHRSRHALTVLSALGFTPRDRRTTMTVMAVATAVVGVVIAVPVGVFVSASVWRRVIDGAGLVFHFVVPVIALLLLAVVVVAIGIATASLQAARLRQSQVMNLLRED